MPAWLVAIIVIFSIIAVIIGGILMIYFHKLYFNNCSNDEDEDANEEVDDDEAQSLIDVSSDHSQPQMALHPSIKASIRRSMANNFKNAARANTKVVRGHSNRHESN